MVRERGGGRDAMTGSHVTFGVSRLARSLDGYLDWVRYVDEHFELVGFGDSQNRWADCSSMLALAAASSSSVTLGPFVSNPITRHPVVAANAVATLAKISDGRAFFGIGNGETSIRDVGARPLPVSEFEAYVRTVKHLLAGEEVEYRGVPLKMLWEVDPVPICVAGDGPRTLQMAGRVADVAIVGNGATPELVRYGLEQVRIGAESVDRDPDEVDVWWMTRVMPMASEHEGFDALRFYLASYANTRYRNAPDEKGIEIPDDIRQRLEGLRSEFRYEESLRPDLTFNADLVNKYDLLEWLGRQFVITGPIERCLERLHDVVEAGARTIIVPLMTDDLMERTRELAEEIVPAFRR